MTGNDPSASWTLRLATAHDVAALDALIALSARTLQAGCYTPQQIEGALGTVFGVDTQLIADGTYYVATAGKRIVGCGGWSRRRTLFGGDRGKASEVDALLDPAHDAARIRAFFVHPDWARHGIGGRIVAVCEAAAQASGFRTMELVATLAGEPFYAAFAFTAGERYALPLTNSEALPVVRMHKRLARAGANTAMRPS
jgi:GNAT superfamily N-acetyltransferase